MTMTKRVELPQVLPTKFPAALVGQPIETVVSRFALRIHAVLATPLVKKMIPAVTITKSCAGLLQAQLTKSPVVQVVKQIGTVGLKYAPRLRVVRVIPPAKKMILVATITTSCAGLRQVLPTKSQAVLVAEQIETAALSYALLLLAARVSLPVRRKIGAAMITRKHAGSLLAPQTKVLLKSRLGYKVTWVLICLTAAEILLPRV